MALISIVTTGRGRKPPTPTAVSHIFPPEGINNHMKKFLLQRDACEQERLFLFAGGVSKRYRIEKITVIKKDRIKKFEGGQFGGVADRPGVLSRPLGRGLGHLTRLRGRRTERQYLRASLHGGMGRGSRRTGGAHAPPRVAKIPRPVEGRRWA